MPTEAHRLTSNRDRILAYLQAWGSATTAELAVPSIGGLRAAARIHELQKMKWDIRVEHVKGGTWRWTLYGKVKEQPRLWV